MKVLCSVSRAIVHDHDLFCHEYVMKNTAPRTVFDVLAHVETCGRAWSSMLTCDVREAMFMHLFGD